MDLSMWRNSGLQLPDTGDRVAELTTLPVLCEGDEDVLYHAHDDAMLVSSDVDAFAALNRTAEVSGLVSPSTQTPTPPGEQLQPSARSPPPNEDKTQSDEARSQLRPTRLAPVRLRNVYVAALPIGFTSVHLAELLGQFGKLTSCRTFAGSRRAGPQGRAYGFGLFERPEDAAAAVAGLSELVIENRRIQIRLTDVHVKKTKETRIAALGCEGIVNEDPAVIQSHATVAVAPPPVKEEQPPPAPQVARMDLAGAPIILGAANPKPAVRGLPPPYANYLSAPSNMVLAEPALPHVAPPPPPMMGPFVAIPIGP